MATLTVRLFGGLGLERAGQPLPLPTPQKAALVLAYLLTAHDRSHPRSLLAGLGWGDQPERRARRNLSDALWRIRTLLEPRSPAGTQAAPVLLFEGDSVRLNPAADLDHDVRRFEAALRDPTDIAAQQAAVDLYRGDLLIGYYDDWVLLERERLRQAYLAALGRVIAGTAADGAWAAAATAAARLLAADPYREDVTRQLMRFYYRLGRRDRALQQFSTLRAVLTTDLGLDPEAETSALYTLMQAGTTLDPSGEQSAIRNPQSAIAERGFAPQVTPLV
ncbi:MAG: cyclase, partial [Chloroflexota bacterium]|nr:cyclase [Chloroflexota bacterium]